MGLLLKLSLLVATLCVLKVYGSDKEDEYRRALKAFHLLQRESEQEEQQVRALEKRVLECKEDGEACYGVPKCCGDHQCYWADGFVPFTAGVCVECVQAEQKCQHNGQCCGNLQCDKGNIMWVDGQCKPKRAAGEDCYHDSQCETDCKNWWPFTGVCE